MAVPDGMVDHPCGLQVAAQTERGGAHTRQREEGGGRQREGEGDTEEHYGRGGDREDGHGMVQHGHARAVNKGKRRSTGGGRGRGRGRGMEMHAAGGVVDSRARHIHVGRSRNRSRSGNSTRLRRLNHSNDVVVRLGEVHKMNQKKTILSVPARRCLPLSSPSSSAAEVLAPEMPLQPATTTGENGGVLPAAVEGNPVVDILFVVAATLLVLATVVVLYLNVAYFLERRQLKEQDDAAYIELGYGQPKDVKKSTSISDKKTNDSQMASSSKGFGRKREDVSSNSK